jgi:hypothetical protein
MEAKNDGGIPLDVEVGLGRNPKTGERLVGIRFMGEPSNHDGTWGITIEAAHALGWGILGVVAKSGYGSRAEYTMRRVQIGLGVLGVAIGGVLVGEGLTQPSAILVALGVLNMFGGIGLIATKREGQ